MSNSDPYKLASGGLLSGAYLRHARQSFLSADQETDFLEACGRPLRKSIRVNTLKASVEAFKEIATSHGWSLTPIPWCPEGFWIEADEETLSLGNTPAHIQGLFYIQEASSMLPPVALFDQQALGSPLVVDMAAAPGSKTTQLAAMLNNRGIVLANELSASRLKSLHHNLVRCGILNTCLSHHDARKIGEYVPELFDFVLLDAPCGGEGTVRKDPGALTDWQLEKVQALAELQQQLILSAYAALKPGGRMVYSTCTLSQEENHMVANFLLDKSDAQIVSLKDLFSGAEQAATDEGFLHVLPHLFDSEGFFIACFYKPEQQQRSEPLKPIYDSPFVSVNKKVQQEVCEYYLSHFGINLIPSDYQLLQRDKEVWLFPSTIESVNRYIKVNRAGMKIAEIYPNKIRSTHELACCLGGMATKQWLEIDHEQFAAYQRGENLNCDNQALKNGEVLLRYQDQIVGVALHQKGKLKNGLPRELVKDNYRLLSTPYQ